MTCNSRLVSEYLTRRPKYELVNRGSILMEAHNTLFAMHPSSTENHSVLEIVDVRVNLKNTNFLRCLENHVVTIFNLQ